MEPHIYHLAPELRRSAIYGVIGCLLAAIVIYWIEPLMPEDRAVGAILLYCILGAIALAMIVPFRWAIYVDGSGVSRRWLIGWDLWSWSDFGSGRIQKRHAFTFVDPQKSWWSGSLTLDLIADAERKELIHLINQHYRLPDAPALPEKLHFKYGLRRSVQLDRQEIRLTVGSETMCVGWKDVQRVRITRVDPLRRDFSSLILVLPGHEIEMKRHKGSPIWGAAAEEVNEFLMAHVPSDRIDIEIAGECPIRKEDVQKELDLMYSNQRQLRICMSVCGLLLVATLIWFAIDVGPMKAGMMAASYILLYPMYWGVDREFRKKVTQLESWLAEIEAGGQPARKDK